MSELRITDGSGGANKAKVDDELRLHVLAVAVTNAAHHSSKGDYYNINTGIVALTDGSESAMLYIKYTGSKVFKLNTFILGTGTLGGTISDSSYITMLRNPTAGTIVSDAVDAPINANLNFASPKSLSADAYAGGHIDADERILATTNPLQMHGTFQAVELDGTAVHQLVTPDASGCLFLASLIICGDKVNNGTIEVRWTDGTNTSILAKPTTTDGPVNLPITYTSRMQGWQDARIDVIVTGAIKGSVSASYVKAPIGFPYQEWDALR